MTPESILAKDPMILPQALRESYFEQGYAVAGGFLRQDWLRRMRDAYLAAVERSREVSESNKWFSLQPDHGRDSPRIQRIEKLPDQDPAFWDFVIASDRATFAYPEVRIGTPTIVGAIRLPQRLRWADAMELLMIGEPVTAERAKEMGLVWKVVAHDDLMAEARTLADRLCKSAPLATRAVKEVATRTRDMGWIEAVRFGETMRIVANQTEDAREGRASFAEKRPPDWRGS